MGSIPVIDWQWKSKIVIRRIISFFRKNDQGQDLSEYCLLTALVALIALGIFWHVSGGMQALWGTSNTSLATAGNVAGAGPGGTSPTTGATTGAQSGPDQGDSVDSSAH